MMTKRLDVSHFDIIEANQENMKRSIVFSIVIGLALTMMAQRVSIVTDKQATNRERYAA